MSFNKNKVGAAAVLAATILIVGSVVGYGLHRAGTVGKPFRMTGGLRLWRVLSHVRLRAESWRR